MRILIIEDTNLKFERVRDLAFSINERCIIRRASNLIDAVREMATSDFELIILDIMMPASVGGKPAQYAQELLNIISGNTHRNSNVVALTAFTELENSLRDLFAKHGVLIVGYNENDQEWKLTLGSIIRRTSYRSSKDFVIITALDKERVGYDGTAANLGEIVIDNGLNVQDIEIDGLSGAVVLLPRPGLSNAAAVTALAIDRFNPRLVAMSGVCAGVESECEIGQTLIAHPCWEYQVGKFKDGKFEIEPYQHALTESMRQKLELLCGDDEFVSQELYRGISKSSLARHSPKIGAFTSGSAVVADEQKLAEIEGQHRKLVGLDMEAYAVINATKLANESCECFVAKSVVDFATTTKGDQYHDIASKVSARFTLEAIKIILGDWKRSI